MKLKLKSMVYNYLTKHQISNILATGLIAIAAIGVVSIGIGGFINTLTTWFSTDFTGVHIALYGVAFNKMMAQALLSLLSTLVSIPLFLMAYLTSESHPWGNKLSIVSAFILITLAFALNLKIEVTFTAGILCLLSGIIEPINQRGNERKTSSAMVTENIAKFGLRLSGLMGAVILFGIVIYIFARGSQNLSWEFITGKWNWGHVIAVLAGRESGSLGGLSDFIIGSLLVVIACEAVALPLGIGSAIYMAEYSSENKLTNTIRFFIETLAGVPSIIFGLLGYIVFVGLMGFGPSILSGGLSLALMILPWNIRVSEEAMKAVPQSYREASYALGGTKWQTIKSIVLYASSPGIITGILLGIGAAIGETAVLIYTTGAEEAATLPTAIAGASGASVPTLATWIYYAFNKFTVSNIPQYVIENYALTGSLILLGVFLAISVVALIVRNYLYKKINGR